MISLFARSGRHESSPAVSCCCNKTVSASGGIFIQSFILPFLSCPFLLLLIYAPDTLFLSSDVSVFPPSILCVHSSLFFSFPLVSLSFPQPSHSSLNIPQNLPVPSLFLSLSLCARIGVGARVLVEVRGLCEWPCERARAARTRRGVAKERVRRRGGGLDMAMWMMFWCWLCS